jgi:Ca2+-binding EF-hand superfamily protein
MRSSSSKRAGSNEQESSVASPLYVEILPKSLFHRIFCCAKPASVHPTESEKELSGKAKHVYDLRMFFKELFKYVAWLLSFTIVIFMGKNSIQQYNLIQFFKSSVLGAAQAPNSIATFWDYLYSNGIEGPSGLIPALSGSLSTGEANSTASVFLFGNRLLGNIRFRQVRIQPSECLPYYLQLEKDARCYSDWSFFMEEVKYSKDWNSDFDTTNEEYQWKSVSATNELFVLSGLFGTYPGSGYVVDLPAKASERFNVIERLQENFWIDLKTRLVVIDFAYYNSNLDLFVTVRVLNEFLASGYVNSMPVLRALRLNRYPLNSFLNFIEVGAQGVVAFIWATYFREEVIELKQQGFKQYFSVFWNIMDVTNLVIFGIVFYIRVTTSFDVNTLFQNTDVSQLSSSKLQNLGFWVDIENQLVGMNAVLMFCKILKYLSSHPRFNRVTRTISHSLGDILAFFLIFGVSLFGFALGGVLILGNDNYAFHQPSKSVSSLLLAVFGDFDYEAISSANRVLGPLFFFSWMLYAAIILLNMAIAIISEAFVHVLESDIALGDVDDMWDYMHELDLVKRVKKLAGLEEKVDNIIHSFHELDADNDHNVSKQELQTYVAKHQAEMSALDVTDAEDIMQKFDADGSGHLDEKEISAMKAYIQDKKDNLVIQREAAMDLKSKIDVAHVEKLQQQPKVVGHAIAGKTTTAESVESTSVGHAVSQMAFKNVSLFSTQSFSSRQSRKHSRININVF